MNRMIRFANRMNLFGIGDEWMTQRQRSEEGKGQRIRREEDERVRG